MKRVKKMRTVFILHGKGVDKIATLALWLKILEPQSYLLFTDANTTFASAISNAIFIGKSEKESMIKRVAREHGVFVNYNIFKLIKKIENNNSEPFDVCDIIKRILSDPDTSPESVARIGIRIVQDVLDFQELKIAGEIEKDNEFTINLIKEFLKKFKFSELPRLERYLDLLQTQKNFSRQFDLSEILTIEKKYHGEQEAKRFGLKLLTLLENSEKNFKKALDELENPEITKTYSQGVITVISKNPEINRAARYKWKRRLALVIQKNPVIGGIQIFPNKNNKKMMSENIREIMDNLIAAIRLEELLLKGIKRIPPYNTLKRAGRIKEVPEWYYTRDRGFFILNRSLGVPKDIPETKIPLQKIAEIAQIIIAQK